MVTHATCTGRLWVTVALACTALAVAVTLALPATSYASTIPLTISERAALSTTVFVGTVGTPSSQVHGRGIRTGYGLSAGRVAKGSAPGQVELLGGRVGAKRQWVSDQPMLQSGHTYLFFLDALGRPIGGPQGAVEVRDGVIVGTSVRAADVVDAVAAASLAPRASQAFPELRDRTVTAAGLTAIDAALTPTATATEPPTSAAGASAAAEAAPAITVVSPDDVAAGTGTTVEIDGSGFGTTPGKIELVYDPHSGTSFARWSVAPASWSNTRVTFKVPVFTDQTGYPAAPGTGSVRITTATGATVDSPVLKVGYAFDGDQWISTPVTVYVNPSGAPNPTAALDMIKAAITTWSAGGFPIQFGAQTGMAVGQVDGDGLNEVGFGSLTAGLLAQTSWAPDAQGHITEEHIVFNTAYAWGDGSNGTTDIQSIALHELGHWVVLRDKYSPNDSYQVMYGYGTAGQQKRALTQAEIDGVRYVFVPDRTPPTTTASVTSSVPFTNGWTSGDVTVTIAPPGDANLRATRYRLDYGPATAIGAPTDLPFSAEGYHDVMVWSTDDAGNNETPLHRTVAIDRTPPTSSSNATSTYAGQATITITGADALSGLAQLQWRLLGSPTWTVGSTATIATPGSYTLEFRALDRAGNAEEPNLASFDVLALEPSEMTLGTAPRTVKYGTSISVDGTLTTNGAELVGQTVQLQRSSNNSAWTTIASQQTVAGGKFSFRTTVTSTNYYRVAYGGGLGAGTAYAGVAAPPSVKIASYAYLATPTAARVGTRTYNLTAMLMPRHAAGSYPVRVYLYRYRSGRWVSAGYVTARAYNAGTSSTRALRKYTFPSTGSWRIRAYHADSGHVATWTTYRTISVR